MATVLITGCSSGFGLLSAVELARDGHRVFATMRDPERGSPLRDAADAASVSIEIVALDVTDPVSVDSAVAHVVGSAGGLDVVVNNAGIEVRGPVAVVSDDEVRQQFETNVFGVLRVVRAAVPHLQQSGDGVIVNISSINGVIARPFAGIYAASKHALEAVSEALHFELGLFGVRVHVIQPGQFATGLAANTIVAEALSEPDDPTVARYLEVSDGLDAKVHGLVPGGAPADPIVVARAVVRAVSDPSTPLRTPVGGDTDLIMGARHGQTFEDYEVLMRGALDYWEGYRGDRT